MGFFSGLLDLLFPPKCVFCGKVLKTGEISVCARCLKSLPFTKGGEAVLDGEFFDACVAPLFYRDTVRKSIHRFKFGGATGHADYYGAIMADCIREHYDGKYDLITWVPLSQQRARTRGYDQAMLLALAVALALDDVAVETLRKTRDARAQSELGGKEVRRANISGAYEAADEELIAGKRILLIDDVVTTGATLSECARVLLLAGAESVMCAALARGQV